jgi:tryptophan-rich sensory protein
MVSRFLWIWLVLLAVVGSAGLYMTEEVYSWYNALPLSPLTPPNRTFPIVWNVLFICMALSAVLVWDKTSLVPFWCLVVLLAIWSFLFFYLQNPIWALGEFVVVLVTEVFCLYQFFKVSFTAGVLLLPLLIWSAFAYYLNLFIVLML